MKVPEIYAEWVDCIRALDSGSNDAEVLVAMQQGKLEWQAVVAPRFSKRLVQMVNQRLDKAQKTMQKRLQQNGAESGTVQALLALRKEIQFLSKVMTLPTLPEEVQKQFAEKMQQQADQFQESLETSAQSDRSGKLLSLVKNTPVNVLENIPEQNEEETENPQPAQTENQGGK